jgi:lysine 2,3-aminomutase
MTENEKLDRIAISVHSHRLLRILLRENPMLETIMRESKNEIEAQLGVKNWIHSEYRSRKDAFRFQIDKVTKIENFEKLSWNDYAIIRILDYIDHAGIEYPDRNLRGEIAVSNPIRLI